MRLQQIITELKQELDDTVGVFREGNSLALYKLDGLEGALDDFDMDAIEERLLGAMNWNEVDGASEVGSVWAQQGWGPALYECVMSITPLKPHPHQVTPAARRVWDKMRHRDDVIQDEHGAYQLTSPLNLKHHENLLARTVGSDPYGEKISLLHETAESVLLNAMRDIYSG